MNHELYTKTGLLQTGKRLGETKKAEQLILRQTSKLCQHKEFLCFIQFLNHLKQKERRNFKIQTQKQPCKCYHEQNLQENAGQLLFELQFPERQRKLKDGSSLYYDREVMNYRNGSFAFVFNYLFFPAITYSFVENVLKCFSTW